MLEFIRKYRSILDYLPMLLVTLLFVAETELEKHAVNTSCQVAITIVTLVVFYVLILKWKNTRIFAFLVAMTIWVILIYVKKQYVILN